MVLVVLTPSSPWTNAGKHKEHLGGQELIFPPACKCSTSYQTICPEARLCPGTKTNVHKLLAFI